MTRYVVTLRFQFPAWDEKSGIEYEIETHSKASAIRKARIEASYNGHTMTGKGRYYFKAVEAR